MLELVIGYIIIAIAILIPLLLLAGLAWVLIHPISLEEANRRHREDAHPADAAVTGGTNNSRAEGPRHPRRVA